MIITDYIPFSESYYLGESELTSKDRAKLKSSSFGLPEKRKYPLIDEKHVTSAIVYFNKCDPADEREWAINIIKAIKRFNMKPVVGSKNRFAKYYKAS